MSEHVALSIDQLLSSVKFTEIASAQRTEIGRSSFPSDLDHLSDEEVTIFPSSKGLGEERSKFFRGGTPGLDMACSRKTQGAAEMVCMSGNMVSETSSSREMVRPEMACRTEILRTEMVCDRETPGQGMEMSFNRDALGSEMVGNGAHMVCSRDTLGVDMAIEVGVDCSRETRGVDIAIDAGVDCSRGTRGSDMAIDVGMGSSREFQRLDMAMKAGMGCSSETLGAPAAAECRICQEEDEIANLESPCACSGSLKFAHRKCVQHWCNEKGDTLCEICQKPFESGYTTPQPVRADSIPINIGAGWDIVSGQPRLFALAADHHFLDADYDEYAGSHAHSAACFRSVALTLVALLLLRHILSMTGVGADEDASTFFLLSLVRAAGFLIPCYIMARAMNALQSRRQRQEAAMAAAAEVTYLLQAGQGQGVLSLERAL